MHSEGPESSPDGAFKERGSSHATLSRPPPRAAEHRSPQLPRSRRVSRNSSRDWMDAAVQAFRRPVKTSSRPRPANLRHGSWRHHRCPGFCDNPRAQRRSGLLSGCGDPQPEPSQPSGSGWLGFRVFHDGVQACPTAADELGKTGRGGSDRAYAGEDAIVPSA